MMGRKFAWLIEAALSPPCDPLYLHQAKDGAVFWKRSHAGALEFTTEADGRAFAQARMNEGVRIAEHSWM